MLKVKPVKETSVDRAKQCSEKVARDHIEAIKLALAKLGIYDLANDCFFPGKAGNITWLVECGNFFNYNLRRGTSRLVTGIKGFQAKNSRFISPDLTVRVVVAQTLTQTLVHFF